MSIRGHRVAGSHLIAGFAACMVLATGFLVLLGWTLDVPFLTRVRPDLAPMKPLTAVNFVLSGLALLVSRHVPPQPQVGSRGRGQPRYGGGRTSRSGSAAKATVFVTASLVMFTGVITLSEYLVGWDAGIDAWMFHDAVVATGLPYPGRMTPGAAFAFTLTGLSLLLHDFAPKRGVLPVQYAAMLVACTGVLALLGYFYGVSSLYSFFAYSSMAVHTAVTLVLLGLGLLMTRPHTGLMTVLTSPYSGSATARRLLPAAVLAPVVLGWLCLHGEQYGWYGTRFGWALFTGANIIVFALLIWFNSRRLNRLDAGRQQAHEALAMTAHDLRLANERLRQEVLEHRLTEQARQQTQQQLYQIQKIESLGTLAGGIAHEFNNILTAVYLNAERARTHLAPSHPARRNIEDISQASARANSLVRGIMTFGRRDEPRLRVVSLRNIIEESLHLLRLSLPSNVCLDTVLKEEAPAVAADTTQIHQIILNLGGNALHALEGRDGTITVALEKALVTPALSRQLGGLPPGTYARLTVGDTGKGMRKAVLDRIFDPFFTTKEPGSGTGLGLSVVHSIVALHKGFVTASSEPDRGSVFHAYFPAATLPDMDESIREDPGSTLMTGNGEHILCVDDDAAVLSGYSEVLREIGYRVTASCDPHIALREFRNDPDAFDLLMTDLSMPGMSGFDLIREARAIRPGVAVILSSGYLSRTESARFEAAKVTAFVQKPALIHDLAMTIAAALKSPRGGE